MSTEYEWRYNRCTKCDRLDVARVSVSSRFWFGYRNILFNKEHPDWGWDEHSPFPFEVRSLDDWRRVFAEVPGELWDEYGHRHDDAAEWLDVVKPYEFKDGENLELDAWLDPEGYYFVPAGGRY